MNYKLIHIITTNFWKLGNNFEKLVNGEELFGEICRRLKIE